MIQRAGTPNQGVGSKPSSRFTDILLTTET